MRSLLATFTFLSLTALVSSAHMTKLATFDGKIKWKDMNDPVMGGVSNSTFTIDTATQSAIWDGEVKIVPKLNAPGFCNAETPYAVTPKFPDASSYTHLLLRVRTTTPDYKGYKVSFSADTIDPQFKSFKAGFNVTSSSWTTVAIPFTDFSNDWSAYTGRCDTTDPSGRTHKCCSKQHPEVCPSAKNLRDISVLGLWTEGVAGRFHLEIQWIAAGSVNSSWAAPDVGVNSTCSAPVESRLRFNVSGRLANDYLPSGAGPKESLASAVCCDPTVLDAEPMDFFRRPDVAFFSSVDASGVTTFYDSACGLPLFAAPRNRSFADWKAESEDHGWPSFREAEVFSENVFVTGESEVMSKCGTKLGTNLPDAAGNRYCIDTVCISGHPPHGSEPAPELGDKVAIATFDGAKKTTYPWNPVNDPVMGGESNSTLTLDTKDGMGVWSGEVRIVPFLHAPGFCNLESPGLHKTATYPDVTGFDGIFVTARNNKAAGSALEHFNVMLNTEDAHSLFKTGTYTANFTLPASNAFGDVFVPWSAFGCFWRGQPVSFCPDITTQLAKINSIGMGTAFPGKAGKFTLDIKTFGAAKTKTEG